MSRIATPARLGLAALALAVLLPGAARALPAVEYGPEVESAFLETCETSPTGSVSACRCILERLQEQLGYGGFLEVAAKDGWLTLTREWSDGDELVLDLPLDVRFTRADPRVDADRGQVALERGPLVYCLEAVDNPGHRLDDVVIATSSAPTVVESEEVPAGIAAIKAQGVRRSRPSNGWWPYASTAAGPDGSADAEPLTLTAVPYFFWGNRDEGAMRVWLAAE